MSPSDLRASLARARVRTVYVLLALITMIVGRPIVDPDHATDIQVLLALVTTLLTALGLEGLIAYAAGKRPTPGPADPPHEQAP